MGMANYVRITDAAALITTAENLGAAVPDRLTNLITAHKVIATTPPTPDPATAILDAAETGNLTEAKVAKLVADATSATSIAEFRTALAQRASRKLLDRFYANLRDGDADAILDGLRPTFTAAAQAMTEALEVVDVNVTDTALATTATSEQLAAWRSLPKHLATLDRIAALATTFTPDGAFPLIDNPRERDVLLKGSTGPLNPRAVMCSALDLVAAGEVFAQPHPVGDVRTSPWLFVQPVLYTLDEARERVRDWAETGWAAAEAARGKRYSSVNGELIEDTRPNPFRAKQPA
ncbi:hypothetical protein [Mycolicibacterium lutetiense]